MTADNFPFAESEPLSHVIASGFRLGLFPMAESRHAQGVGLYTADPRAIIPLDGFHCPRSLARLMRSGVFEIRRDTAFGEVIRACAEPRRDEGDTWINDEIIAAYEELHEVGITHSVEAYRDGRLVGGLYGVALGAVFFAESMFHRADMGGSGASKVCIAHLVAHLRERRFGLLDVQMVTPVTSSLGATEIPEAEFLPLLRDALAAEATF